MYDKNILDYTLPKFKVHEKNYPRHDLELAVVAFTLKILLYYLNSIYRIRKISNGDKHIE